MKLEDKHVAPYYPYGLTFKCNNFQKPRKLGSFNSDKEVTIFAVVKMQYRPYLRPLSMIGLKPFRNRDYLLHKINKYKKLDDVPFTLSELEFLCKNHFDYRGLIQEGLAIDINTSKE